MPEFGGLLIVVTRAAMVLLIGSAALAERLGLEIILGTFIAGAVVTLVDRDEMVTHP